MGPLTREIMLRALTRLDELLSEELSLIVGGGGAMILAHQFPSGTTDVDAIPKGIDPNDLDPKIKQVAAEQSLPTDWLNPHFATFSHTLPPDYGSRLIEIFKGKHLSARALSKEEMLIMKCFAGRPKDVGHAKALIRGGADLKRVETHIEQLAQKRIPGCREALDFLDDVLEQME